MRMHGIAAAYKQRAECWSKSNYIVPTVLSACLNNGNSPSSLSPIQDIEDLAKQRDCLRSIIEKETRKVVATCSILCQAYARDFTNTSHLSAANAPLREAQTLVGSSDRRHLNVHCCSNSSTGETRLFHDPISSILYVLPLLQVFFFQPLIHW